MFSSKLRKNARLAASLFALPLLCGGPSLANGIISNPGRYDGGSLGVQTQTGSNCSSSAPDRPSFSLVGGKRSKDYDNYGDRFSRGNDTTDFVGGAVITIPFGGPQLGDCSALLEMEEQRSRLDLAITLFEAGAMSAEELRAVAAEIKGNLEFPVVQEPVEDYLQEGDM